MTANKINEDISDVPQSVTVIDETTIEEKGIKNIADLLEVAPSFNLSPTSPGRSSVNIRGLNSSFFTNNNPVVIYVDGVPHSGTHGFDISLANVERVEILRGPQGTLYGRDSIGGVINVITKEPANEWAGKLEAEVGNFDHRSFKFNTGGALAEDELYLNVSGQFQGDDGWITNDFPGNERDANKYDEQRLNASLIYQPTDRFRAKFSVSDDHIDSFGLDGQGFIFMGASAIRRLSLSDAFDRDDAENTTIDIEDREDLDIDSQALQFSYELDAMTVSSVTTRRHQRYRSIIDYDASNSPFVAGAFNSDNHDLELWTQEFTLKRNHDEGLRYVVGLYFEEEEFEQGPFGTTVPTFAFLQNADSVTDSSTAAVFGQLMYPLTENLELTLGGRYQRIDKEIDLDSTFVFGAPSAPNRLNADKNWSVFLPRTALKYDLNDTWTVYASYAEGYMPGGFNTVAVSNSVANNTFDPQRSSNYEIGVKFQTANMTLAAAVFYMDIEDIHVFRNVSGVTITDNADEAHSKGIEVEMAYKLTQELELTASAALIDAKYDNYSTGTQNYSGQDIQRTPKYTFNVAATYYHANGFYARADVNGAGETAFLDFGRETPDTAFPKRDTYAVLNTRIGYLLDDWEFYAYANNLNDEEYVNSLRSFALGPGIVSSIVTFNDPRSFGVGVRYNF